MTVYRRSTRSGLVPAPFECGLPGSLAGFFIACTLLVYSGTEARAAEPSSEPLVKARVIVGAAALASKAPTPAGVVLTISPGWHIYWLHPGDSGMSTSVAWDKTPGLTVDGVRWPAPERFITYETIHANGYEGEVVLPATLTLSGSTARDVVVSGKVSWLACRGECIKGSSPFSLTLPVTSASTQDGSTPTEGSASESVQADAARIAAAEMRVPTPWQETDPFELSLTAPTSAKKGEVLTFEVEIRPRSQTGAPATSDTGAAPRALKVDALFLNAAPGQWVAHEERLSETRVRVQTTIADDIAKGTRLAEGVVQVRIGTGDQASFRYVQVSFPTKMGPAQQTRRGAKSKG